MCGAQISCLPEAPDTNFIDLVLPFSPFTRVSSLCDVERTEMCPFNQSLFKIVYSGSIFKEKI